MTEPREDIVESKSRERFEKWCPITIVDIDKAPKAAALKSAYWTAWQAAERDTRERCAQQVQDMYVSIPFGTTNGDMRHKFLEVAEAIRKGGE